MKRMGLTMKMKNWLVFAAALGMSGSVLAEDEPTAQELRDQWKQVDTGDIPLNQQSPTKDIWRTMRDDLSEGREPGPINVQRWIGHYAYVGMPTMYHLPIALTKEDLEVGQVEVAFMGAELVGDPRARTFGPAEMRNPRKSQVYHTWGALSMPELDTGRNWQTEMVAVDYGDAPIEPFSLERTIPEIRKMVREIASVELENGKRTVPFIIGGAHSLMYPDAAAISDVYGAENFAIIHFDAHADYTSADFGHLVTHGNPIRRLIREELVNPNNIIQVGLRGPTSIDIETLNWGRGQGLRYHMMAEVEVRGWQAVMTDVIAEAKKLAPNVFISFDVDVIDPTFVPGTSTPEPGGLYIREVLPLIRRLCAETNVIGFELVELRPDSDPGYTSVQNSSAVVRQCLNGMAVRKAGITEENYYHPDMIDDGK